MLMGWYAVDVNTGKKIVADAFEANIDKYIRKQRKKGIVLKKFHDKNFVPTKMQLQLIKEQEGRIKRIE